MEPARVRSTGRAVTGVGDVAFARVWLPGAVDGNQA